MPLHNGDAVAAVTEVEVVRRSNFGWQCMIGGRPVFVASLQVARGFMMPGDGERGTVMLTQSAVRDLAIPSHLVQRA